MIYHRPSRLLTVHGAALFAVVAGLCIAPATPACAAEVAGAAVFGTWLETGAQPQAAQQTPPQDTKPTTNPAQQQPKQQPAPKPQQPPQNPFENVPETPQNQPKNPPTNPVTPPNGIQEAKPVVIAENMIEEVQFRGQKKVPQDTLRALIFTKKGDVYDEDAIHRDFISLWNTGRFDDLRVEKEKSPNGGIILRFVVTERRTVHTIDYTGNKSISKSEILDRFKDRHVNLTPESQFDPGKVQRAKNVLQEYEAERGHQYASVIPQLRQVPPGGVDITFAIDEGPKVKVGNIIIQGNTAFSHRDVVRAMKNLKPIGIPHSLLFESLFARTFDSTKLDEDGERIRQFYQSRGYFTARVINHSEKVYDVYGRGIQIPLLNPKKPGKHVDVTMVVAEGDKYTLRNFNVCRNEALPHPGSYRAPSLPHGRRRRFLNGEAAEGLGRSKKALRKLWLYRFRRLSRS